ncbi:MAG: 50S ribosomal protein L9 [Planctomycetota bacterium]|jgi:large subunit ribosomal protein L9
MANVMKVLLCEDIRKLGWLGDIVEVNTGYARNYLLPQGLARVASEANIRALAKEKAKRAERRIGERKRLEQAAAAVEGAEAVLAARANEQGVLFGSVGAEEIAANLREQGFEVANEIVQLEENIKHVGTHSIKLEFADDLTAAVSVIVVAEGVDIASLKEVEDKPAADSEAAAEQQAQQNQQEQQMSDQQ